MILEEDAAQKAGHMALPERPTKTALQVEEIGSYKLESHESSISYQVIDDGSGVPKLTQGIVDEMESDTDQSRRSRTTSRAISINSVAEDDAGTPTGNYKTCELSVDEIKKNVPFEDGFAEMKITKIVMQEEEVMTAEVPDGVEASEFSFDLASKKSERDVQSEIEAKARRLYAELATEDDGSAKTRKQQSYERQTSLKGAAAAVLYDIEESREPNAELSPEEARQQRIKEMRANARRASLKKNKEDQGPPTPEIIEPETTKARSKSMDVTSRPPHGKRASLDSTPSKSDAEAEPRDAYLETLLAQSQRQRSVLGEIIDQKERSLSRSRDTSRQGSIADDRPRKGSVSSVRDEPTNGLQRADSHENRPNFKADLEDCQVREGEPVRLEVKIESEPLAKLTWFHDGEQIRSDGFHVKIEQKPDGSASLLIDRAEPTDSGDYQVLATNEHGTAVSCAEVTVAERREPREKRPLFVDYLDSCRAVEGFPIKLEAKVIGHPKPELQWFHDGEQIKSDDDHIKIVQKADGTTACIIDSVEMDDRGEYKIVATNDLGKSYSSGYLSVSAQSLGREPRKQRPEFIADLHNREVIEGQPLDLQVKVAAHPDAEILWLHDGEEIRPDESEHITVTKSANGVAALSIDSCTPKDSGEYIAIAANDIGAVSTKAKVNVSSEKMEFGEVSVKPYFVVKLQDQEVQRGELLEQKVKITASPQPTCKWLHDGQEVEPDGDRIKVEQQEDGTTSLLIDNVTDEDGGEYLLIATNDSGSASSRALVTLSPIETGEVEAAKPVFVTKLQNQEVQQGSSLGLNVRVRAYPQPELQWTRDDEEIEIDNDHVKLTQNEDGSTTLTIDNIQPSDSGEYKVVATNKLGSATSKAQISVTKETAELISPEKSKPIFITKLDDQKVQQGSSLGLKVRVRAYPQPDLQWQIDDEDIDIFDKRIKLTQDDDGCATLTIDNVQPSDSGKYKVIAKNDLGSASSEAKITVTKEAASVVPAEESKPVFITKLEDQKVQQGSSLGLKVRVRAYPQPDLQWQINNEDIDIFDKRIKITQEDDGSATVTIDNVWPSDAGKYNVIATNKLGSASSSAQVTVTKETAELKTVDQAKPVFETKLQDQKVQQGSSLGLKVKIRSYPNTDLQWLHDGKEIAIDDKRITIVQSPDGTTTLSIDGIGPEDTGEYTVIATNDAGTTKSTAFVAVSEAPGQLPHFDTELNDAKATESTPVKFEVKVSGSPKLRWFHDSDEIPSDDENVTVTQKPDGSAALAIGSVSASHAGKYKCVAQNKYGIAESAAELTVLKQPEFERELEDVETTEGLEVRFDIKVIGIPMPELKFLHDGAELSADSRNIKVTRKDDGSASLVLKKVTRADSGDYRVVATNEAGSAASSAILSVAVKRPLKRYEKPSFDAELTNQQAKEGEPVQLEVQAHGTPEPTLKWLHDGEPIKPDGDHITIESKPDGTTTLSIADAGPADAGEYRVVATNESGSVASDARVDVSTKPVFSAQLEDTTAEEGKPLELIVKADGWPEPEIKWLHDGQVVRPNDDHLKTERNPDGSNTLKIESVNPEDAGEYEAIASNSEGSATTKAEVNVSPSSVDGGDQPPEFIAELEDVHVNEGSPLTLKVRVRAYPQPDLDLKWYHNDREIRPDGDRIRITQSPDGTIALVVDDASPADAGEYRVVASNDAGKTSSGANVSVDRASVHGTQKPAFVTGLSEAKAELGSMVKLIVKVSGMPEPSVSWLHNGEKISPRPGYVRMSEYPDGTATLVLSEAIPESAGEYTAVATNDAGTAKSTGLLIVFSKPIVLKGIKDESVIEMSPVQFELKFEAYPKPEITWLHDGVELVDDGQNILIVQSDDGTATLSLAQTALTDAGDYQVLVKNDAGKATSRARLSVAQKREEKRGEAPVFVVGLEDTTADVGTTVKFEIEVAGSPTPTLKFLHAGKVLAPRRGFVRITENPDGTAILQLNEVSAADAGHYQVQAKNSLGETLSNAVLSIVAKPSIVTDLGDVEVEKDAPLQLEVKIDGLPQPNVKWLKNGSEIVPDGKRVRVSFNPDTGVASLLIDGAEIEDGGEYRVVATNDSGTASSTGFVSVVAKPTDDGERPAFVLGLHSRSVEVGSPVKFDVKVSGTPTPKLKWLHNGQEIQPEAGTLSIVYKEGDGSAQIAIASATPNDVGEYRVIASNEFGTAVSDAVLSVVSKPEIVNGLRDADIIEGAPIKLQVIVSGCPQPKIKWFQNGVEVQPDGRFVKSTQSPDGTATLEIAKSSVTDGGEYQVTATNDLGSAASNALINVTSKRDAVLRHGEKPEFVTPLENCEVDVDSTAQFECKVAGVPLPTLKWLKDGEEIVPQKGYIQIHDNDDGSGSIVIKAAALSDAGRYRVIATNESGTAASTAELTVLSKPLFIAGLRHQYVIEGTPVEFKVKISGYPAPEVRWLYNGKEIEADGEAIKIAAHPDGTHSLSFAAVELDDAGEYSIVAVNKFGKSVSDAILSVSPNEDYSARYGEKPLFVQGLDDATVDEGFPIKLEVKVSGKPLPEIKWLHDGEPVKAKPGYIRVSENPDGTACLTLHEAAVSDGGVYQVIATNELGSAETSGRLTVSSKDAVGQTKPARQVVSDDDGTPGTNALQLPMAYCATRYEY